MGYLKSIGWVRITQTGMTAKDEARITPKQARSGQRWREATCSTGGTKGKNLPVHVLDSNLDEVTNKQQ